MKNKRTCTLCGKNKSKQYFSLDGSMECLFCLNGFKSLPKPATLKKELKIKHKNKDEIKKGKRNYPKEFSKKRKSLLEIARGGLGCSDCSSIQYLQVHHLDKNINNNNDDNLLVLCYFCHSKYHKHMRGKNPPKWLK